MSIYTLMPLHGALGLAVIGIDLGAPIDAETGGNLQRLLARHLVLVFPDQSLTPEQCVAAASVFGRPIRQYCLQQLMPGYPDILVWCHRGRHVIQTWRADQMGDGQPAAATILYGAEIPSSGGGTSIANMCEAYWALPEEERGRLETLRTVNHPEPERYGDRPDDVVKLRAPVFYPMVHTHPVSHERAVYFDPEKTLFIEGMTPEASKAYLADLVSRLITPDIVYRHSWVKGDVLVIDDRVTLQRAHDGDEHGGNRVLWRIIVDGERPLSV